MRIIRALGASLLWIVAGVLGLVGVLLCATIILLPVGIPVLMLARRVFSMAMALLLPRKVRHPVDELGKVGDKVGDKVGEKVGDKLGKKARKKAGKKAGKAARRGLKKAKDVVPTP